MSRRVAVRSGLCVLIGGVALPLALVGCGARQAASVAPERAEEEVEAPPPPLRREGTILRAELEVVLERGVGRFLQRVRTAPHLDAGRFVGHRLLELEDPLFADVDLQPGDTLLRVNGMPIERPEQALAAWNALRVASELTLDLLRDGEPHQLRYAIQD